MTKVFLSGRTNLNEKLIIDTFEMVNSIKEADIVICQSTLPPDFNGEFNKTIYIAVEPPLADHRLFCYSHFNDFLLVVTHNADISKPNQWSFTDSDEPQFYPTNPLPSSVPRYTRMDTKLGHRGIFYAGMIGPYESQPNAFGGINLTKLRRQLGEFLKANFKASVIIGIGWNGQETKVSNWRLDKSNQIKDSDCDFVLALENTFLPNYLYEKIWDGFASDRVTLYLGDTRIDKHIPTNCFVDLREYFHQDTGNFDFDLLKNKLLNMTQDEYDSMLNNARNFRETAKRRHEELEDKLTNKLIEYIRSI